MVQTSSAASRGLEAGAANTMTDLALLSCFIMFVTLGCLSPFVLSLGYVWVDALLPQQLSYGLLNAVPISFIMGAGAVLSYLLMDRKAPPRISMLHVMCGVMALWITATSTWAVAPDFVWRKWDPSFKTLVFTVFMPFVFRSRVQIEAFVLVLIMSTAPHLLPWGVKTFLSGGGYGLSLGLLPPNSSLMSESSTIAAISTLFIPLLFWMRQHSLLIPWQRVRTLTALALSLLYLVANVGTFARTGLIAMSILGFGMFIRSTRKVTFVTLASVIGLLVFSATSDKWTARISTIGDYNTEASANTRILVWQWTWEFAKSHPFGGGFNSFLVNVITDNGADGEQGVQFGRAFHNIYFATLGEHGYPGLALYLAILVGTLLSQQSIIRKCKGRPELEWASDLARASQLGLFILMACALFIDISYSFVLWDLVALNLCLRAHIARVLDPASARNVVALELQTGRQTAFSKHR